MPLCTFAAVYAAEITLVVLGKKWADTAVFVRIFSVTGFIRVVLGTTGVVLITSGHSRRILKIGMLRNAVLIVLTLIGVPWGAVGVAMAQLGTAVFMLLPSLRYTFPLTPVTAGNFLQALRTPLVGGAAMITALFVLRQAIPPMSVAPTIAIGAAVSAVFYIGACLWLPEGRRELAELREDLAGVLSRKNAKPDAVSAPAAYDCASPCFPDYT